MERSGSTAPGYHDDGELHRLLERDGPFVTVWANRDDPTPSAVATRARATADEVGAASSEVRAAVKAAADAALTESPAVVVVADAADVVLTEELPRPLRQEATFSGPIPALSPVIEHRQSTVPFLTVLIDRLGADLTWSAERHSGESEVVGDDTYVRKVQAGGWSQRTFQQRAENTWEQTAHEVADELARLATRVRPRVVTLAGDVRMTELLRKRIPADLAAITREVDGGRSEDGSADTRDEQIRRWLRTAVAEDTVATLQLFEQERGQHDRAADGAEATFAALREARVDTLLVHDDGGEERRASFVADEPGLVALDRDTLEQLGRGDLLEGRLVDVAIRAAVMTSASVRVVPAAGPLDGSIGAVLRW